MGIHYFKQIWFSSYNHKRPTELLSIYSADKKNSTSKLTMPVVSEIVQLCYVQRWDR